MPSNSEMYEQGALDAEQDELNPFYYQHYYYYRRGYDDSRRRLRRADSGPRPMLIALALGAAALALGLWLLGGRLAPAPEPPPAPAAAAATPRPTRPAATATAATTATPAPTPAPALAAGARARVANLSGSPLRAREAPGLGAAVVARIPEGSEVTVAEGPVEADGLRWWRVESGAGAGWVAEGSAEGVAFLEPTP